MVLDVEKKWKGFVCEKIEVMIFEVVDSNLYRWVFKVSM